MARISLLLIAAGAAAFACTCSRQDEPVKACQIFHETDIVFRGRVIDHNEDFMSGFRQKTLYRFRVLEAFKGLPPGTSEVFIDPASGSSCYRKFEADTDYLIFTARSRFPVSAPDTLAPAVPGARRKPWPASWVGREGLPVLVAGSCNPSKEVREGDPDLEFLRSPAKDDPRASGSIEGRAFQSVDGVGSTFDTVAVSDATATVIFPGAFRRTVPVNRDGRFRIEPVPPVPFQLLVESKALGTARSFSSFSAFRVPPGGCAVANPMFVTGATISGRIVDSDGEPAPGVRVSLGEVREDGTVRAVPSASQNSARDGSFTLRNVPAARIVVAANLRGVPDVKMPFEAVYVPGTQAASEARIFTVKPLEQIEGVMLRLPPPLPFGDLLVTVRWADGAPVESGITVFAEVGGVNAAIARSANSAPAVLPLALGRRYDLLVRASLGGLRQTPDLRVPLDFTHHGQTREVRLDVRKPE